MRLEIYRKLCAALRRYGCEKAEGSRCGNFGQNQYGRIRNGLVQRELGVRFRKKRRRPHARSRRKQRRLGERGCGVRGLRLAGFGHGRKHTPAGFILRRGGIKADVLGGFALRTDCVRFVARPDWTAHAHRRRQRAVVRRNRRTRPDGFDVLARENRLYRL